MGKVETTEDVLADLTGEVYRLIEDAQAIGAASAENALSYLHELICKKRYELTGEAFDREMPARPFPRKRTVRTQ